MQQMFGSDNHYIQDEGCGHLACDSGENTGYNRAKVTCRLIESKL